MDTIAAVAHKYQASSDMTFEQVFNFAFEAYMPIIQALIKELGQERALEALKKHAYQAGLAAGQAAAAEALAGGLPAADLAAYADSMRQPGRFAAHVLTLEIVEDSPRVVEVRVTGCLWAKTFRELNAPELGDALICHPDYAHCQGFNPRIKMLRTKTLMRGDDCCNHRFIWQD